MRPPPAAGTAGAAPVTWSRWTGSSDPDRPSISRRGGQDPRPPGGGLLTSKAAGSSFSISPANQQPTRSELAAPYGRHRQSPPTVSPPPSAIPPDRHHGHLREMFVSRDPQHPSKRRASHRVVGVGSAARTEAWPRGHLWLTNLRRPRGRPLRPGISGSNTTAKASTSMPSTKASPASSPRDRCSTDPETRLVPTGPGTGGPTQRSYSNLT